MKIAFLCKRKYMGKDVILDRYARLYEIPHQLSRLGHQVEAFCCSYQQHPNGDWQNDVNGDGKLNWHSRSLGRYVIPGLASYPFWLAGKLKSFMPDILIGSSDIPHAALAQKMARILKIPYVVDLYDNFEGFGQARLPGMVKLLRYAVRHAALVTTTSDPLSELVKKEYRARGRVMTMPSTVDHSIFFPRDQQYCRHILGLPKDAVLIGTAGGLLAERGIGDIYEAWKIMNEYMPQLHLVLAGPIDQNMPPPNHPCVHYLGMLAHEKAAILLNALDVGIIYLRDTPFGRYCFPQKFYEMKACNLPIVATNLGVMPQLLSEIPYALYNAGDSKSMEQAIHAQLRQKKTSSGDVLGWDSLVTKMEENLRMIHNQHQSIYSQSKII